MSLEIPRTEWCRLKVAPIGSSRCETGGTETLQGETRQVFHVEGTDPLTDFVRYPGLGLRSILVSPRVLGLFRSFRMPPMQTETVFVRRAGLLTEYRVLTFEDYRFDPANTDYLRSLFFLSTVRAQIRDIPVASHEALQSIRDELARENACRNVLELVRVEVKRLCFLPGWTPPLDLFISTEVELAYYVRAALARALVDNGITGFCFGPRMRIYVE